MSRTASTGIRVEPVLKAAVESAAKAHGRTVAQWIERLILKEMSHGEVTNATAGLEASPARTNVPPVVAEEASKQPRSPTL